MEQREQGTTSRRLQGKRWIFTYNNPVGPGGLPVLNEGVLELPSAATYLHYQLERGAEGTLHYQGFVVWRTNAGFQKCKDWLASAHWELSKGTFEQCLQYNSKEETRVAGPWILGEPPKGQGHRSDLASVAAQVLKTGSVRQLALSDPAVIVKYGKGLSLLASYVQPPRRNVHRLFIVGPSGIGKTHLIWDLFPELYSPSYGNGGVWWDGYADQKTVLLDEFKGQMPLQRFLQVLDEYPLRLEIKGNFAPAHFDLIVITSNSMPEEWYDDTLGKRSAEIAALVRRTNDSRGTLVRIMRDPAKDVSEQRFELQMEVRKALDNWFPGKYLMCPSPSITPQPRKRPMLISDDSDEEIELTQKI